ncbi:hypothetical protein F5144DRAFT_30713 [Chaetomium tenue]|uniref:Uncharacterized protein n=1 Tax=Chaetomium tenue TaxID=1854479 RepID=A0ACB7PLB3_9PEZI|nr:hypothetical protein F5144DRAFT_30713 [Chaetomium globosum]
MDMDYMDPYRRRYAGLTMQPYTGHQQAHPQDAQYPYWNPLMVYYQQQHRAAALMGQGNMHLSKPAEPKPRLAKDEVELLEREFSKNQKPSSSTKRELAEQMGVEVPRINNWFQNRRAKEKQIKKTAEFEAQQARERAASDAESTGDQDQELAGKFYPDSNQDQSETLSTATFGQHDDTVHNDYVQLKTEPIDTITLASVPTASACESPSGQHEFQPTTTTFPFRLTATTAVDGLSRPDFDALVPQNGMAIDDAGAFSPFAAPDYFALPSVSQFSSEMIASNAPINADNPLLRHQASVESLAQSEVVSPDSMAGSSPSTVSDLRFKSPPPPADIAGRRKSRRPAPLGLSSLRGGPGPKTGIEMPRRADTVSPMRRVSSATGSLRGRVQKSFMGPGGPRSPFPMDRNREVLLQSLPEAQAPAMPSLNNAMSPMSPERILSSGMGDCAVGPQASDDEQGYPFSSLGALGGVSLYNNNNNHNIEHINSPPGTPGLHMGFREGYFPVPIEPSWNYVPQDEPLPTPSLCSHGGSELEFSMAPQLPGYVASQPVTPSFPPTMGPAYASFFGTSAGQTEYHFPDSYPTETSARSSPVVPPRSKQFQFAQNVTPQDFNPDKS